MPTATTDGGPDPSSPGSPNSMNACTCYLGCPSLRWFLLANLPRTTTDWNLSTWCWLMIGSVCDSVLVAADNQLRNLNAERCCRTPSPLRNQPYPRCLMVVLTARAVHNLKRFMLGYRLTVQQQARESKSQPGLTSSVHEFRVLGFGVQ